MRIVVDAMGTDERPAPDVAGAVMAARKWGDTIILVGDKELIQTQLSKHDSTNLPIEVVHASQDILMSDKVPDAKAKSESSMHVGMQLMVDGKADAFVSAGNTTGLHFVALLAVLKRMDGVMRPGLSALFPTMQGRCVAIDIGANTDSKPEYLHQFAIMGSVYAQAALGIENPKVGLLSNGEEDNKGDELVRSTFKLLSEDDTLNFVGNIEPKPMLYGEVDVIVQDGFVGNLVMKGMEATASLMGRLLRKEITAGTLTSLGGALARPALKRVSDFLDPYSMGGAPLLGVNGPVISAHGSSPDYAIMNAVERAREMIEGDVINKIKTRLATGEGEKIEA
ncbi:MAG: phosphate acyltransferase PlsX [Chloroflexi bacterium]|nr:phosphate acyltransferase PlsX [Chloroflexota bacterium]